MAEASILGFSARIVFASPRHSHSASSALSSSPPASFAGRSIDSASMGCFAAAAAMNAAAARAVSGATRPRRAPPRA